MEKHLSRVVRFWLLAITAFALMVVALGFSRRAHGQEKSQTFYASQFSGADKGTKVNNALLQCQSPGTITCIVIVDATMVNFPVGPGYAVTGAELVIDYSVAGQVQFVGGAASVGINGSGQIFLTGGSSGILAANPGGGSLGTTANPIGQLVIGDGSGRTRWLAGCCTATRTFSVPDGNSSSVMLASLTTTAATTDNVSVTGMTSSGHCALQATNAGAAGGIASVFVSAKAANQITVTHTATAGWTFDVLCTAQ